ncbi:hypothetical protein [Vibrio crassostreae]|uniref:hypothetical protein n=1 Tax=Vibrio crassostreae TaxID=246167 RepID=UPI001B30E663|nr:hypothetical protein [Vibrio crassostreae]
MSLTTTYDGDLKSISGNKKLIPFYGFLSAAYMFVIKHVLSISPSSARALDAISTMKAPSHLAGRARMDAQKNITLIQAAIGILFLMPLWMIAIVIIATAILISINAYESMIYSPLIGFVVCYVSSWSVCHFAKHDVAHGNKQLIESQKSFGIISTLIGFAITCYVTFDMVDELTLDFRTPDYIEYGFYSLKLIVMATIINTCLVKPMINMSFHTRLYFLSKTSVKTRLINHFTITVAIVSGLVAGFHHVNVSTDIGITGTDFLYIVGMWTLLALMFAACVWYAIEIKAAFSAVGLLGLFMLFKAVFKFIDWLYFIDVSEIILNASKLMSSGSLNHLTLLLFWLSIVSSVAVPYMLVKKLKQMNLAKALTVHVVFLLFISVTFSVYQYSSAINSYVRVALTPINYCLSYIFF